MKKQSTTFTLKINKTIRKKGFTLVELMVVIAIIAILAVGGISSYQSYILKGQASRLHNTLKEIENILTIEMISLGRTTWPSESEIQNGLNPSLNTFFDHENGIG